MFFPAHDPFDFGTKSHPFLAVHWTNSLTVVRKISAIDISFDNLTGV